MAIKLYHCKGARSVRPLWTLEEMGIPYELESMKFPPRFFRENYLDINPLGTVPCLTDGDLTMTESAGICQYLVDCHGPSPLGLTPKDKDYGLYLNCCIAAMRRSPSRKPSCCATRNSSPKSGG
jgi:glutathione S-transferase